MNRTEERIEYHAVQLWEGAGRPAGGPAAYHEEARELAAIEENGHFALKPVQPAGPFGEPVEESVALENLGEFPTLTDQGDEQTFPDRIPGDVAEAGRIEPKAAAGRGATPVRDDGDDDDEDDSDDDDDEDDDDDAPAKRADDDDDDDEDDEGDEDDDVRELDGDPPIPGDEDDDDDGR